MYIQVNMSSRVREALRGNENFSPERCERDAAEEANKLLEKIEERKRLRLKHHATIIVALASKYPNPFNLLASVEEDLARGQSTIPRGSKIQKPSFSPCSSSSSFSSSSFGVILLFIFIIGAPIFLIFLSSYLTGSSKEKVKSLNKPQLIVARSRSLSL